jgi:hypothetical protein
MRSKRVSTSLASCLKKLGYKQVVLRHEGARGEQTRIYKAVPLNQAISDDIIKALETKWAEHISAGIDHFNREESINKMVNTEPQISTDWFSEGLAGKHSSDVGGLQVG